jgi:hypothetical protein
VGFDSAFLEAFLDAILSVPDRDARWVDQSIALLDGMRWCGRFSIAKVFVPQEKWKSVFVEVERMAEGAQRERIEMVKQSWLA